MRSFIKKISSVVFLFFAVALFLAGGHDAFAVNNPIPVTASLFPIATRAGGSSFALTVRGGNFMNGSVVQWNGSSRATTFISSSSLTAVVTAVDIFTASSASITVVNPTPGGGVSNAQIFTVVAFPNGGSVYNTDFENFAFGDVDSQFGWTSGFIGQGGATTALFDVKIVSNTYGYSSFQIQSLRISDATTSSAFGDQTFSASLADEAGETNAATSTYSGGERQPYFAAQWDFASAVPGAEQPGLAVVASADPGNGSRMSWLQMQDTSTGLQLNFEDYESAVSDFVLTPIATGIDRTMPHTVKMTIQFVDGPSNDIVKIYLDGTLIHTGTTWEDYSRSVGSEPSPVDSIMFRVAGTAAPATAGKGFLIDNFSEFSGPVPTVKTTWNVPGDNSGICTTNDPSCATIQAAVAAANSCDTINVSAGTYAGGLNIPKCLILQGPNAGVSPNTGTRVLEAIFNSGSPAIRVSTADPVTIDGFTFNGTGAPIDSYTTGNTPTIKNNIFKNTSGGNLFFSDPATFIFRDNRLSNLDPNGEGVQIAGNWNGTTGTVVTVADNVWINSSSTGMNASNVSGNITGNTFLNVSTYGLLVANNASPLTIASNTFQNITNPDPSVTTWGAGIRFYAPAFTGSVSITSNTFMNDAIGIAVRPDASADNLSTISISGNTFSGDTIGVFNAAPLDTQLNAIGNWWGDVHGPKDLISGDGSTPNTNTGNGSPVNGAVNYSGWCANATCSAIDSFNYVYADGNGVTATGTLTGTLIAPGEYSLTGGTITLTGAPACTNCGSLSGPLNGTGTLVSPPPQPFQVGGGTELIGLDDLLFPNSDPQLDTNGGLSFQMSSGLGVGIGGNGPGNYWIFGGNWSLNDNNGNFVATTTPVLPPNIGATKFIFANVTSSVVVGTGATFNIEAVNSSGTVDTSFQQGVTLTVGGSGTGGGLVTIIDGVGTSTVSDNIAQTITLGLEDSQSTGLNVNGTASVVFLPGSVLKFTLNHPGNMNTGTRLGYTVGRQDQFGNFVSASGTVVYLYTNSSSTNAAFFDASTGGTQISSTTILDGSTSTAFWYYDDLSGSRTITVSDNASAPDGVTGIADASDTFMIAPGAVKFIFANVPSNVTAGSGATANVYAVDSFNTIDPSFNGGVTVTASGSATGGGLVTIVNGVGTTTITDATAETVTLGLQDTQSTGLGVGATTQTVFNALPVVTPSSPQPGGGPSSTAIAFGIKPSVTITFSGMAYPGASVMVIRKDLGLQSTPVTQAVPAAKDGSFLVELDNVIRLTGQTYLLSFVDKNGLISQTKAYNVPAQDKLVYGNILAAPTLGFSGSSVAAKGKPVIVTGYATPKATVELFIDGNAAGTITVNDPSGKYSYTLATDNLTTGRHAVWAIQKYAEPATLISGYTNSLSQDELFVDDATNGTLISKNASGTYTFVPAITGGTGGSLPVTVSQVYTKQAESDFSNQQSFTISPLANPKLDLNGDGVVDLGDVSIFLVYLKNLNASLTNLHIVDPNIVRTLDFNGDGVVDATDVSILFTAAEKP